MILGWGAKIAAKKPKRENRSNVVTISIRTLKMVHIKKILRRNLGLVGGSIGGRDS